MCKKPIVVSILVLFLATWASATVVWDFEDGEGHGFELWSAKGGLFSQDLPDVAGDERLTGYGTGLALPSDGVAWSIGSPNQYDGLQPPVEAGARVGADGLLDYSLGAEIIPTDSGTLNTFALNQNGDFLHDAANDQIATSPPLTLGDNAVLTVWAYGGGNGSHAPEYAASADDLYTDGSVGVAVISAEDDDLYAFLGSVQINGGTSLQEATLDLSAFGGKKVFVEVVDATDGSGGWLAVDEIQISNTGSIRTAGFITADAVDLNDGLDGPQVARLESLGYLVKVIESGEVGDTFTKADANGLDLLVVSESISSSGADPLIGTSAPVMHEESYGWDNWGFISENASVWQTGTNVTVVNDSHAIVTDAGLSMGDMQFFTTSGDQTTSLVSILAPGAELLGQITVDSNDYSIVFALEKGAELANGTAVPNRAVGFSLPGNPDADFQADHLTDEAWAWFDACVRWLDPPAPTAAMIVNPGDLTAGFDQAQYDRLVSMGYQVTVVAQADVGSSFTREDADGLDLLLISESISSSGADPLIGTTTPVMHNEAYGWDNWLFTTNTDIQWLPFADLDIVNDAHPIALDAGVSAGTLTFFDPAAQATAELVSALAPGAELIAQATSNDTDYALIFTIEQGAELADGSAAPARSAGFSIPGDQPYDASVMTGEAWSLWDATINWLRQ